jgi:hypothetical protein
MPFRTFRLQKQLALKEAFVSADIDNTIFVFIPNDADAGGKQVIANETAAIVRKMSDNGDVVLLATSLNPQN